MNTIEEMLTGQIEMSEFIALLKSDPTLQNEIRNIIGATHFGNSNGSPIWPFKTVDMISCGLCAGSLDWMDHWDKI